MAENRSSSSGRRGPTGPLKSQKLDRTLQELESAFTDWESLSSSKVRQAMVEEDRRKAEAAAKDVSRAGREQEIVEKTKKLLSQLREQLSELND